MSKSLLYVKHLVTGKITTIKVDQSYSLLKVKQKIQEIERIPISQQRLTFNGDRLVDDRKLSDYYIQNETILELVTTLVNTKRLFVKNLVTGKITILDNI